MGTAQLSVLGEGINLCSRDEHKYKTGTVQKSVTTITHQLHKGCYFHPAENLIFAKLVIYKTIIVGSRIFLNLRDVSK